MIFMWVGQDHDIDCIDTLVPQERYHDFVARAPVVRIAIHRPRTTVNDNGMASRALKDNAIPLPNVENGDPQQSFCWTV
jgi:hypothetical protein